MTYLKIVIMLFTT